MLTFDREAVNYNEEIKLYELEVDDLIVEGPTTNSVTIKYNDPYTLFYGELDLGGMGYGPSMIPKKMNYFSGDSIYWWRISVNEKLTGTGEAYIDLIIKSEEKIIGYAVVKVDYWGETEEEQGQKLTVLKSVLFPALDGIFQKVTEEQVRSAIDQVKAEGQTNNEEPGNIEEPGNNEESGNNEGPGNIEEPGGNEATVPSTQEEEDISSRMLLLTIDPAYKTKFNSKQFKAGDFNVVNFDHIDYYGWDETRDYGRMVLYLIDGDTESRQTAISLLVQLPFIKWITPAPYGGHVTTRDFAMVSINV